MNTDYMNEHSHLPAYMPYARFLLDLDITMTAKVIYTALLDRATLSQSNGWVDKDGRLYLIFPIASMAETIGRTQTTVKNALNELENNGLIERRQQGLTLPNHIYVKLPVVIEPNSSADNKLSITGKENLPSDDKVNLSLDGQKTGFQKDKKLPTNNLSKNNISINHLKRTSVGSAVLGRYKNILLSDDELAELKMDFPSVWQEYVERLSEYMASTGKSYQSHTATIRRWITGDQRKALSPVRDRDYSVKEGETV